MRKILYSPGFGAGWSSWNSGEVAKFMLTYQPIIDAIENKERMDENHPAVLKLQQECKEKFGEDYVCVLGAENLQIAYVNGGVRIHEYDGSESVEEEGEFKDWL